MSKETDRREENRRYREYALHMALNQSRETCSRMEVDEVIVDAEKYYEFITKEE